MKWIQSRFDTCSAQRFINSSNLYLLTTQQKIRYWPVESGHYLKRIPHRKKPQMSLLPTRHQLRRILGSTRSIQGTASPIQHHRRNAGAQQTKDLLPLWREKDHAAASIIGLLRMTQFVGFSIFRDEYKTVQNFKVQIRPKMSCSICFSHFDQCKRSRSSVCPFFWAVAATLEST